MRFYYYGDDEDSFINFYSTHAAGFYDLVQREWMDHVSVIDTEMVITGSADAMRVPDTYALLRIGRLPGKRNLRRKEVP